MVIISGYRLEYNQKNDIFVNSEEDSVCPLCGSPLKRRDSRRRVHRTAGGKKQWYLINRLKCTNKKCHKLHNELPDCIVPYKQYGEEIIEDVIEEVITPDDLETEDYPCEETMNHWKWWLEQNKANIDGQMKSVAHHLLDLSTEFLKSGDSLLEELRKKINPGWLSVVVRFIYNSGGRIEPCPTG
jgi:hypothetical protein